MPPVVHLRTFLVAALFLAPGVAPAQSTAQIRDKILEGTNAFRQKNGKSPLRAEPTLMRIAQAHCENMARQDRYGDDDKNGHVLDGKDPRDRAVAGEYNFARLAENVGWSRGVADVAGTAVTGWINSPPHRKNLLDDLTEIGIGAAQGKSGRWYFCQMFGIPAGAGGNAAGAIDLAITNATKEKVFLRLRFNKQKFDIPPNVTFTLQVGGLPRVELDLLGRDGEPMAALVATPQGNNRFRIVEADGKLAVENKQ